MILRFFVVFLFFGSSLFSAEYLKREYFSATNDINLSIITHDKKNDIYLFSIDRDRYLKRVSSKRILQLLKKRGYRRFKAHSGYITFYKQSPLDFSLLKQKIRKFYQQHYEFIDIHKITIIPRNHLEKIPSSFVFKIKERNALRAHANFSIKENTKQIFFEYFIDADLYVYKSKRKIKRGEVLDGTNLKRVYIKLDKFYALPIQHYRAYQAKYHINPGHIITQRDVEKLALVKRGEHVSVIVKNSNIEITMSARALQAGSLNDIIPIQNEKGMKFHAKVIGKNRVEVNIVQ